MCSIIRVLSIKIHTYISVDIYTCFLHSVDKYANYLRQLPATVRITFHKGLQRSNIAHIC